MSSAHTSTKSPAVNAPAGTAKPNRRAYREAAKDRKRTRKLLNAASATAYRDPVAFARSPEDRIPLAVNPNTAKRRHSVLDRDSATAKRDGAPTKGAKLARRSPLGNRTTRYGSERIPNLPLTTRKDGR